MGGKMMKSFRIKDAAVLLLLVKVLLVLPFGYCNSETTIFRFDHDLGARPNDSSDAAMKHNTQTFSQALAAVGSNSTILFPKDVTFYLYNGVRVYGLEHAVLQIDGTLQYRRNYEAFEFNETFDFKDHPPPCFVCKNCRNITLTSSTGKGVIHGGGPAWWGIPLIGYLQIVERRPFLLLFNGTQGLWINNITLLDAPFYNLLLTNVNQSTIHDIRILSRRTASESHGVVDLSAFNTDGIDVAGHDIHVHDVEIWTQDDCIAVKDNLYGNLESSNMVFERIHASGLGLVIGSISGTTVRNITFRDSYLYRTFKGIYMKFRLPSVAGGRDGLVADIYYENITMESPLQWPIWVGPAQQSVGGSSKASLCHPSPCSLCWPNLPFQQCHVVPNGVYRNITLKDVQIRNPAGSPGVIMGDDEHVIEGMTFENVEVVQGPVSVSPEQLHSMFSSLNYPVDDPIAKRTVAVFVSVVSVLVVVLVALTVRRIRWHTSREINDGNLASHCRRPTARLLKALAILATVAFLIAFIIISHTMALVPQVSKPGQYFVCQGVRNGVAKGSTFPVPHCFADETVGSRHKDLDSSVVRYQVVLSIVLVAVVSAYILVLWRISRALKWRDQYDSLVAVEEELHMEEQQDNENLESDMEEHPDIGDFVEIPSSLTEPEDDVVPTREII